MLFSVGFAKEGAFSHERAACCRIGETALRGDDDESFARIAATGEKSRQIRRLRCNLQRHNSPLDGYKSA
jgi:hypothetical protein